MRSEKDRLHRVLVIGATPAGIVATNKLGEMGIPVTLIDRDPDLNEKLARDEWRLASGLLLSYAHRPGLLRILRNQRIRCILPGEILSLKHTPQGFSARYRQTATYVDPDRCTLCGRCAEVCPAPGVNGTRPIHFNGRQSLPGRPFIDKRRRPLCQENCPLGVNVQGYMALARAGRFADALELIRRDNVLPGICGRICTHPCEAACRRGELDEPLAIRDVKRFVADHEGPALHLLPPHRSERPQKVAVIGSGPAGLAAAADLARQGYPVTVFEKESVQGGLLRHGIGPYRLPREILDRETARIEQMGVTFRTSACIDLPGDLDGLRKDYAAIILTTGSRTDRKLGVPGEDMEGVEGCLAFLRRFYTGAIKGLPENLCVIGDGSSAIDTARACVRFGARVTILSWFPEAMIPADPDEVRAAREEGVSLITNAKVAEFIGSAGRLRKLRCVVTQPGHPDEKGIPWPVPVPGREPFELEFDRAIVAIGQIGNASKTIEGIEVTPGDFIAIDGDCRTSFPDVYAAGDAVTGPTSVVKAMASGREAAAAVHRRFLREPHHVSLPRRPGDRDFPEIAPDVPSLARVRMPERQLAARTHSFSEVALGLSESQTGSEAARCLQCGVCSECLQCVKHCISFDTIRHDEECPEETEHAGVVIIADPEAAPAVKGEDVLRAYSTKTTREDVYSMMLRGFAAAADAMILLGGNSQRMRGHGLSFTPPDPQLSPELRIGVFVCRCNDAFGWLPELSRYVADLQGKSAIEHAEVMASACSPEGSGSILKTIREKGLTRIVLASCVCCPLDYVCSACTDQRSRLKSALFHGTGVTRAMAETCNLRGEVLRLLKEDPASTEKRFTRAAGTIDRKGQNAQDASHPRPSVQFHHGRDRRRRSVFQERPDARPDRNGSVSFRNA